MKLFYATSNPAKIQEVAKVLNEEGIKLYSPKDLGIGKVVEETGNSLEENAILKVDAYLDHVGDDYLVMSDDSGLEIDALGGEPGIRPRRWAGYEMSDEEIIDYALDKMKDVPKEKRTAHFSCLLAIGSNTHPIKTFRGDLSGEILETEKVVKDHHAPGYPYDALFYATEYDMLLADIHALPQQQKQNISGHRERAVKNALPYLKTLLQQ